MVFILLLGVFAGCGDAMYGDKETTPSVNAGANPDNLGANNNEEKEDDPTRVFTLDSLEPLSKEKQAEVEAAWTEKKGGDLYWCATLSNGGFAISGERYYGTFNDRIVVFTHTGLDSNGNMELAGQTIIHGCCDFNLFVYYNGEFYRLNSTNQYEWFTESDLLRIVEYHNEFEEYCGRILEYEKE